MSVTLDLPDDIGQRLLNHDTQAESDVRRELAIALYREGKLPPGRAAEVAGMDRWDFDPARGTQGADAVDERRRGKRLPPCSQSSLILPRSSTSRR